MDPIKKEGSDMNPFLPPYKPGLYIGEVEEDGDKFVALVSSTPVLFSKRKR